MTISSTVKEACKAPAGDPGPSGTAQFGRRPRIDGRAPLEDILFKSIPRPLAWRALAGEIWIGGHSLATTVAWRAAGVWDRLHQLVLDELSEAQLIDRSRLTGEPSTDEVS